MRIGPESTFVLAPTEHSARSRVALEYWASDAMVMPWLVERAAELGDPYDPEGVAVYRGINGEYDPRYAHVRSVSSWTISPADAQPWGSHVYTTRVDVARVIAILYHAEYDMTEFIIAPPSHVERVGS